MGKKIGGTTAVKPILLSEVIDMLKQDLFTSAKLRPDNWTPLFKIIEATIETNVRFERSLGADGKLNVYVLQIEAEGQEKSEASHRISLKLAPLQEDIADKDVLVAKKMKQDPMLLGQKKEKEK